MKVFVYKLYSLLIFFSGLMSVFAGTVPASGPPSPTGRGAVVPPPPPGLPIDDYVFVLIIIALFFGFYVVNKRQIKTKPSILD